MEEKKKRKTKRVRVTRSRTAKKNVAITSTKPAAVPVAPIVATAPVLELPPVSTNTLSYNRSKVWAAVAVTMAMIILVWVYALPYTITVSGDGSTTQLMETSDNNVSQLMSDIQQSWNNLTQQAVNLSKTTTTTNVPSPAVNTNTASTTPAVNQTLPTNEDLDNLFSDIN